MNNIANKNRHRFRAQTKCAPVLDLVHEFILTMKWLAIILIFALINASSEKIPSLFNGEEWVRLGDSVDANLPSSRIYKGQDELATIFVAVASYRDERCPVTLKNLFSKAAFPDRIVVGLVEQIHTEEDNMDCIQAYCRLIGGIAGSCPHKDQIKHIEMSFNDARGPVSLSLTVTILKFNIIIHIRLFPT